MYDIYYNNQFVCRTIEPLLKGILNYLTNVLPFDGEQTGLVTVKVKQEPKPETEKTPKEAEKKA